MTAEQILEGQVFLVDKPLDWTSFQAVNKIKFKLKKEFKFKKIKVGHAGTLDPKATGLLVVCTGRATKKISEIQDAPKEYWTEIKRILRHRKTRNSPYGYQPHHRGFCDRSFTKIFRRNHTETAYFFSNKGRW